MPSQNDTVISTSCPADACGDDRPSRRGFLEATGCFGAAIALLGLSSTDARALPVALLDGLQAGSERRYPIPATDSVNVDRGAQLILARVKDHVYVFSLSCPHQNNAVKWMPNDHRFQCTKHDSRYQPDGVHTAGRATRNLDRYLIRRDGDAVVVDLHRWVQSDKDPAGWAAATLVV
ncbi:MAG TPA: Rieske (2Fe-2S) protein [Vicinamibacterales bacterium]|jgi:nitrite reductase/ring-hydroxylating ferredoxin subunit|nr:Rieske (2Fe-2S) protein [Vicinamibacterales bacterium]